MSDVEASFIELYAGQALATEVIGFLIDRGFTLMCVANLSNGASPRPIQADFLCSGVGRMKAVPAYWRVLWESPVGGGDCRAAQADGRTRRQANPLAHRWGSGSSHGVKSDFIVRCTAARLHDQVSTYANYFLKRRSDGRYLRHAAEPHARHTRRHAEPWRVTLVDTGEQTQTGGRLKRVAAYLRDEDAFCLTYGDGVSDVNITQEIAFHRDQGLLATVACVQPPGRYGALDLTGTKVTGFTEKPKGDGGWINAGFFVLSPKVIDFIDDDTTVWERTATVQARPQRRAAGRLPPFGGSGIRWTPCVTRFSWTSCGKPARRPGKYGRIRVLPPSGAASGVLMMMMIVCVCG